MSYLEKIPAPKKKIRYGKNQGAAFQPQGDKTEEQEYKSGGLPEMTKYTVNKK